MSKLIKVGILISGKIGASVKRATTSAVKDQTRIGSAISKVQKQLGDARQARKYGRVLNELKAKQRALGRSSDRLDKGIEEVERRYNEARRAASRYGSEIGEVERKTRRLGDTQRRNSGISKGQISAVGGATLGASLVSAGNREEEGLYLRTVINARDGDKGAAVGRSRRAARDFARDSLADENEIIEIEYALNSAGLEEEVSRAGGRMVHKVAKITRGQSGQVGEIMATTFNNLGNQMIGTAEEKMARIGNILTKTQFQYQIRDFDQLGASMEYGLSTAAAYKISLDQTTAAIGFLNSAGFQGSRGGTAFSAIMRNMTKAGDELGFSMIRGADGSLDFMATVSALGQSLEGLGTDEKADLIGRLFGDEGKGPLISMLENLERLKQGHEAVAKAADADLVDQEYLAFLGSSNGQWLMLRQNIGQTATLIGGELIPVLGAVLSPIGGVMKAIAWGIDNVPGFGLAIGVLGAFIVGTAFAMGTVTTATWAWNTAMAVTTNRKIIGFTGALSKGLLGLALRAFPAAIIGTRALGLAIMTTPIGWIIGGIALVVGSLIWLTKKLGGPKKAAQAAWLGIKTIMSWSPAGLVKRGWDALPSIFGGNMALSRKIILGAAKGLAEPLLGPIRLVQNLWDKLRGVKKDASSLKVGTVINDNFNASNDNAYIEPQSAKRRVGDSFSSGAVPNLAPVNAAPQSISAPTPISAPTSLSAPRAQITTQTTTHHREGDNNTYIFNGVLDGEEAVRKLEPHLKRLEQENSEANLHD